MNNFKIGDKVEIFSKKVKGIIAYDGFTQFSPGVWLGINLDEPKGRNNGSINGIRYFKCERNCGIFVRPCQVVKCQADNNEELEKNQEMSKQVMYPNYLKSSSKISVLKSQKSSNNVKNLNAPKDVIDLKFAIKKVGKNRRQSNRIFKTGRNKTACTTNNHDSSSLLNEKNSDMTTRVSKTPKTDVEIRRAEEKCRQLECLLIKSESKLELLSKKYIVSEDSVSKLQEELNTCQFEIADMNRQLVLSEKREIAKRKLLDVTYSKIKNLIRLIENVIVEKEMFEMKCEQFEDEIKETKLSYDLLLTETEINKEKMEEYTLKGVHTKYFVENLEKDNELLKLSLNKLKDLYLSKRLEHLEAVQCIDSKSKEILSLKETVSNCKTENKELSTMLDTFVDVENYTSELILKNLSLEQEVQDLKETLEDTEELLTLSEEIEEVQQELKTFLVDENEKYYYEFFQMKPLLVKIIKNTSSSNESLKNYKALTSTLKAACSGQEEEIREIKDKYNEKMLKLENLRYNIRNTDEIKLKNKINSELSIIELELAKKEVQYLSFYFPDEFFITEYKVVKMMLLTSEVSNKLNLLSSEITSHFYSITHTFEKISDLAFAGKFLLKVYTLQCFSKMFEIRTEYWNAKDVLPLNTYYDILNQQSRQINNLTDMFSKNKLNPKGTLENMDSMAELFLKLLTQMQPPASTNVMENNIKLEYQVKSICIAGDCIIAYITVMQELFEGQKLFEQCLKFAKSTRKNASSILVYGESLCKNNLYLKTADNLEAAENNAIEAMKMVMSLIDFWELEVKPSKEGMRLNLQNSEYDSLNKVQNKLSATDMNVKLFLNKLETNIYPFNHLEQLQLSVVQKRATIKKQETLNKLQDQKRTEKSLGEYLIKLTTDLQLMRQETCPNGNRPYYSSDLNGMLETLRYLNNENKRLRLQTAANQMNILSIQPLERLTLSKIQNSNVFYKLKEQSEALARVLRNEYVLPVVVDITKHYHTRQFEKKAQKIKVIEAQVVNMTTQFNDFKTSVRCGSSNNESIPEEEEDPQPLLETNDMSSDGSPQVLKQLQNFIRNIGVRRDVPP